MNVLYSGAPPSKLLLALEGMRAIQELAFLAVSTPFLPFKKGDGHPVLVLPGLLASDESTRLIRKELNARGFVAYGWQQGRNCGLRQGTEDRMLAKIRVLHAKHGKKVSLVGWSLGGLYARQLAKVVPDHVRSVITLGSPFAGEPTSTNAYWIYQRLNPAATREAYDHHAGPLHETPPVPTTAIYSKSDGVCAWQSCVEPAGAHAESVEVWGSHIGLGHNPSVMNVVFDRLLLPEGEWKPFDRSGWTKYFYPGA
ncbi:lipase precursor [Variibacter gotjawalensis]|uniref:Lipase n=1 Tax=Variibacter gotjawalensis TaxID=1333996 RepID=A0A0S3Q125_9BRAD|nr:alpha/beta fold hydrolase [Variibacter gotjawalensis]NIK47710.1 pimeloyl-ACP methyl ester carboxylesterase [Variibacter gotjawalensis]RZS49604.1 alpha/beta hydrolase family protein [Variibacter gotjawalensis]BAT61867.1 lipase precursor [Variibacter gotjawalensis]